MKTKSIKMDLVKGERLRCSECSEWTKEQCVWMYIDDDEDVNRLLCEECQKEEEKKSANEHANI